MKRMFTLALLISSSFLLCLFGQQPIQTPAWVARLNPLPSAAGGITYLVSEDFEGAGAPAGWSSGGTPNWDYNASPLVGSESLSLDSGDSVVTPTFATNGTLGMFFAIRFNVVPTNNTTMFQIRNSTTNITSMNCRANGAIRVGNGASSSADIFTPDTTTIYYIWLEYVKGTGTNAVSRLYWTNTTTKPSASVSVNTGAWTIDADNAKLIGATWTIETDYVRIRGGDFVGSAP